MAKYFLGSVGKAEALRMNPVTHELELAFVSKTLTDSGLNISTTKDDIRAGEGAPIVFSFYHDSSVEITLTDVQWKKEYLRAQLGAQFDQDRESYKSDTLEFSSGKSELKEEALKLPYACPTEDNLYVVWAAKQGSDEWFRVIVDDDHKSLTLPEGKEDGKYCVRYLAKDAKALVAEINSTIIPEELFLIVTAPIYAGDSCAATKGRAAGHITFEVPRFQLNGAQEFSMNMSSNQNMSLAGIALSSESMDCEKNGGKLLRVIEVIDARDPFEEGVDAIEADPESLKVGEEPVIFGIIGGAQEQIENSKITFTPALVEGKFSTATTYTIKFKDDEAKKIVDNDLFLQQFLRWFYTNTHLFRH